MRAPYWVFPLLLLVACTHVEQVSQEPILTSDQPVLECPEPDCQIEARWSDQDYVEWVGNRERRDYYRGKKERMVKYDPEGRVVQITENEPAVSADLYTGERRTYFGDGHLKREISFIKGDRYGSEKTMFDQGGEKERSDWKFDRRQGVYRENFPTGKPKLEANYERGLVDGVVKTYFDSGMMNQEVTFRAGLKQGLESTFYRNGSFRSREEFRDGKKNGRAELYDPYGSLLWQADFEDDQLHGRLLCFHPDGKTPAQIIRYHRGAKTELRYLDTDGKTEFSSVLFRDGSPLRFSGNSALVREREACSPEYTF